MTTLAWEQQRSDGAQDDEPQIEPLLKLDRISKRFGTLIALQEVSLQIAPGEVIGLVGRRGAGKSTLLQLIGGLHPPTTGTLSFNNQVVRLTSPAQAQALGIAMVHQTALAGRESRCD